MERKIEYYQEERFVDYVEHLSNSSMDECIESWRNCLDEEINYPCEIVVYGYAEKNKDTFIPNGKEILDDILATCMITDMLKIMGIMAKI